MPNNNIDNLEDYTASIEYESTEASQHDLESPITLYYSSKDPDNPRNLYLDETGAEGKTAEVNANYFPTDILWMYIYGFTYINSEYKQVLFRITYPSPENFKPTRKQIKKIVDLLDYIELYRPKNGIKWYTISKKEFNERVGILNQYWGMNLPTKTGEYRYSKKVNKWLASTDFEEMSRNGIVDVSFNDLCNMITTSAGAQGTSRTLIDIMKERLDNFINGFKSVLNDFFGGFFNPTGFMNLWESFWQDDNNNWIPDGIENAFTIKIDLKRDYNFDFGLDNIDSVWTGITNKFTSFTNGINSIFNTSASWWNKTLWNKIAQKIIDLLHLNIDIDNTPDN